MDALTAIAACSLHPDLPLVVAMALVFSGGNPYAVQDARQPLVMATLPMESDAGPSGTTRSLPHSASEARAAYARIRASGAEAVLGLLPVPASWAVMFGRKPEELFDACVNVSIATARLSEFEYACGTKGGRACALRAFAHAVEIPDLELYVTAQLQADGAAGNTRAAVVLESDALLESPILTQDVGTRDWGPDRIFFALPPARVSQQTSKAQARAVGNGARER